MRKRSHKKVREDAKRILKELNEHPDTPQLGRILSKSWLILMDTNPEYYEGEPAKEPRVYWPKELAC